MSLRRGAKDLYRFREGHADVRLLNALLDEIGEEKGSRGLRSINCWLLFASHALEKVLKLCNERVHWRSADLFDETVVPIQQFAVVGAEGLMRAPVNLQAAVEEVRFY